MEQQAKERLTGAVILVVLLVLLVPELLTGPRAAPPAAPAQPDQAPIRSYTMELGQSARAGSAPVAASTTTAAASQPAPLGSAPHAAVDPVEPVVSAPAPGVTEAPSPAQPEHAAAAAPAPHSGPPHAPSGTGAARGGSKPVAARESEHAAAWTVQLGTFSNRENATHLAGVLKSHGFSATVSEAVRNGHKLFRVRVGTERDRAAAQKLLGRIRAAGQKGGEVVPR